MQGNEMTIFPVFRARNHARNLTFEKLGAQFIPVQSAVSFDGCFEAMSGVEERIRRWPKRQQARDGQTQCQHGLAKPSEAEDPAEQHEQDCQAGNPQQHAAAIAVSQAQGQAQSGDDEPQDHVDSAEDPHVVAQEFQPLSLICVHGLPVHIHGEHQDAGEHHEHAEDHEQHRGDEHDARGGVTWPPSFRPAVAVIRVGSH